MSTINEKNIIDIDDSQLLANTPMMVVEQNGQTLAIPLMGSGTGDIEQVQADWAQTDDTAVDFIKNKPAIPRKVSELSDAYEYAKKTEIPTKVADLSDGFRYAKKDDMPSRISYFYNDCGYATASEIASQYALKSEIPDVELTEGVAAQAVITDDTSTAISLDLLAKNTRYVYTNPITSIYVHNVENSNFESEIQCTLAAAPGFTVATFPDNLMFIGGKTFVPGNNYIINIKNNIAVVVSYE